MRQLYGVVLRIVPLENGSIAVNRQIVLGTRGSKLALRQSEIVKQRLEESWRGLSVRLEIIKTTGDKITDAPLATIGGKGLFVKEIEEALLDGHIDLAVHSMKDMPAELPAGLTIGAIPMREDPRDVVVTAQRGGLYGLRGGARVGTSSVRRMVQITRLRPDLHVEMLRGNLDTRLRKVRDGHYDAAILAAAGLHRMGWDHEIGEYLDPDAFLPAIGQGALGIEIRDNDRSLQELLTPLHHEETAIAVRAERSFLCKLEGGCQVPIGGYCSIRNGRIHLVGMVASLDGTTMVRDEEEGNCGEPEEVGRRLAMRILDRGGREILASVYPATGRSEV